MVKTVLFYGGCIWVVTKAMMKVLEGFHHRAYRRIAGMSSRKFGEGRWEWSSVLDDLEAVGMWLTNKYIWRWQATIAEYIANNTIYGLCLGEERMTVSSRFMQWWDPDITR